MSMILYLKKKAGLLSVLIHSLQGVERGLFLALFDLYTYFPLALSYDLIYVECQ